MKPISDLLKFSSREDIPLIYQSEAAECGLACLLMVAQSYGYKMDLSAARNKFNLSLKGLTLRSLVSIADKMNLQARPIRVELEHLDKIKTPAILHWNLSHFVVLSKFNGKKAVIHDPAKGIVELTLPELSNHFTGVALDLTPNPEFIKVEEVKPVKITDFWTRAHGLKRGLLQIIFLSAFLQLFVAIGPLLQQLVIDDAITKQDSDFLLVLIFGVSLIGLFQTSVTYVRSKVILIITNTLSFQMTANLFRHLMRLPLSYFEKRNIGDITTRFSSIGPVQGIISAGISSAILDFAMAIATLTMALTYSVKLTLLALLFLLINFLIQLLTFPYQKKASEKIMEMSAKEQSIFLENIQAARTIKIFGQETARENIWLNRKADNLNASISLANFNINLTVFTSILGLLQIAATTYLGARYVMGGTFTLGMLIAFQSYSGQFSGKISSLISQFMTFRMLKLHLQRLADILHTEKEPRFDGSSKELAEYTFKGEIRLDKVRFRYADDEPWIIDGVDMTIRPGEMVALVGPSGGGKSTLLKLILGLLPPTEGTIYLDGVDIQHITPSSFRREMGVVMQDDKLLSGTIAENISFFSTEPDDLKIEGCAQKAYVHDDIVKNPMGYYTLVGDMGTTLSGGQKQRIFLARALYKDPKILFLDEGTANLDPMTEHKIVNLIKSLKITRLTIAHRPALIEAADAVYELKDKKITEIMIHKSLRTNETV